MTEPVALSDPSARIEAAFRAILETRMRGLPVLNPAVEVEAVGFRAWEGHWLGMLVTPWFINVMLLPREPERWRPLGIGAKRTETLPSGDYEFIGAREEAVGEYLMCSLISPVLEFGDHETARTTAQVALDALLEPQAAQDPGPSRPVLKLDEPLDRRAFLRARFLGGARE